MATLYELTEDMRLIQDVIDLAGGELTEAVEAALDAAALNKDNAEAKLEGYGKLLANLAADVEGYKAEEKRLAERRRAVENLTNRLKDNVFEYMTAAKKSKIKAGTFTFAVQKSSPALAIESELEIPGDYYIEQDPKLDRKTLLAALKTGVEVPGCSIKQGSHLRIR